MESADAGPEVLFEADHVGVGQRVAVALGTGLALVGLSAFVRWGLGGVAISAGLSRTLWAVGALVSAAMIVAALRARTVYRVEVANTHLVLWRDPGVAERFPLTALRAVASEAHPGGWSRDPSERLVLTLTDGTARRFTLHDEADTPGIVRDLRASLPPAP